MTPSDAPSREFVDGARPVLKGAASPGGGWQPIADANKEDMRFFKVTVELP